MVGVVVPVARDLAARRIAAAAGTIEIAGYVLLLVITLALAAGAGLTASSVGLSGGRPLRRVGGGLLLAAVLSLPAVRSGVALPVAIAALPAATGIAIVEELLFRGVLVTLARRAWGDGAALLTSAAAFGVAHAGLYPLGTLLVGCVVGLLLGVWRLRTDDLVAPILGHAAVDALAAAALR